MLLRGHDLWKCRMAELQLHHEHYIMQMHRLRSYSSQYEYPVPPGFVVPLTVIRPGELHKYRKC